MFDDDEFRDLLMRLVANLGRDPHEVKPDDDLHPRVLPPEALVRECFDADASPTARSADEDWAAKANELGRRMREGK
jgi:hypothetical protein